MYAAFYADGLLFRFPSQRFFLAGPKNRRKRPNSHESVADAVGVLDFPRKSFVQIAGRVPLSFSLSPTAIPVTYYEKEKNYETRRICVLHYTISLIPENVLSAVKSCGESQTNWSMAFAGNYFKFFAGARLTLMKS